MPGADVPEPRGRDAALTVRGQVADTKSEARAQFACATPYRNRRHMPVESACSQRAYAFLRSAFTFSAYDALLFKLAHDRSTAENIRAHGFRFFQQAHAAVGIGQQVHHEVYLLGTGIPGAQCGVKPAPAQLRLAQHPALVCDIFFQCFKYLAHDFKAALKAFSVTREQSSSEVWYSGKA